MGFRVGLDAGAGGIDRIGWVEFVVIGHIFQLGVDTQWVVQDLVELSPVPRTKGHGLMGLFERSAGVYNGQQIWTRAGLGDGSSLCQSLLREENSPWLYPGVRTPELGLVEQ